MKVVLYAAFALMLFASPGTAQNFQAGLAAYNSGNYAAALREWRPLADQGNARAQLNLGFMYENGQGVPQDYADAVRWYRLAAEQGDDIAQANLGTMYGLGRGVPQDYVTAHMWYNIAAANGNRTAADNRDIVVRRMTAADISEAQRRARVCLDSGYRNCR
jgi:uncharacterized protein